ncbi:hypothetical protein ACFC1B_06795 [Streptomyces xiamenensis]|uniref:hypothetical protein n=1 Tax=Streptomyces xiamenensis TaxID=408015 RepID=UPI0035D6145D
MIVVVSAHGAGVTVSSLALALASAQPTLLVEADYRFGSVRTGLRQGQPGGEVGIGHLGLALREGQLRERFGGSLQHLAAPGDDRRLWLPGLTDPLQAADLEQVWAPLAGVLREREAQGWDVIVDAGQLSFRKGRLDDAHCCVPLIRQADMVLLVVRSTHTSVAQTRPAVWALLDDLAAHGRADAVRLLAVEEGALKLHDVAGAMGRSRLPGPPVVAALPWEERTGHALTHGVPSRMSLAKSRLLLRARQAAQAIRAESATMVLRHPVAGEQPPQGPPAMAVPRPPGVQPHVR